MKTNTLILGDVGSGKTECIKTLLPTYIDPNGKEQAGAGKRVMYLAHEPGARAIFGENPCEYGLHIKEHFPAQVPIDTFLDWLKRMANMTTKQYADLEVPILIRRDFDQFASMVSICKQFICDICGEDFGDASTWEDDTALVTDGLTGLTMMAVHYINGPKAYMTLPSYQPAQNLVENFVRMACGWKCSYVLISHWSRETDVETRQTHITLDTVGNKLAPKLLKIPDEVICACREGLKFRWSTLEDGVKSKVRRLPYSENITPSFVEIFKGEK